MTEALPMPTVPAPPRSGSAGYTVVARRYRPQRFEEVIGQDHVVQALRNAILMDRVTHAYLFGGTRGVGKTSLARIFAKCLNCRLGPTVDPDLTCPACQAIAIGQDIDVIEIDGASNNGVEQVRELQQVAQLKPSHSRYKIFYIDEVHMLSGAAFNALLKILEEPPAHIKFLFATTEVTKIPVTVLSRCQRFELAGIAADRIAGSLAAVCEHEGLEADPDALGILARRAGGSMRDAQSLLEQLLSTASGRVTVDLVAQQLGVVSADLGLDLVDAMATGDPAAALRVVDRAQGTGVQPAELLVGVTELVRDAMILAAGAGSLLMATPTGQVPRLAAAAGRWPLDCVLGALEVLDAARRRLKGSPFGWVVVEMAVARAATLQHLAPVAAAIERLEALEERARSEPRPAAPAAPRPAPRPVVPTVVPGPPVAWDTAAVAAGWPGWAAAQPVELATKLAHLRPVAVHPDGELEVAPVPGFGWVVEACRRPDLGAAVALGLRAWAGRDVALRFVDPAPVAEPPPPAAIPPRPAVDPGPVDSPLVRLLVERLGATPVRVEREPAGAISENQT